MPCTARGLTFAPLSFFFLCAGFANYMGSASGPWPVFKHMLPEVAFAGHSNCGKSSLVNALSGRHGSIPHTAEEAAA